MVPSNENQESEGRFFAHGALRTSGSADTEQKLMLSRKTIILESPDSGEC